MAERRCAAIAFDPPPMCRPNDRVPAVRRLSGCVVAVFAAAGVAVAQAEPAAPPAFQPLRQNEDWSRFRGGDGPLDAIKRMPLRDDEAVWLSLGGRFDTRVEGWDGFGFGATVPGNRDTFALSRMMLHADLHAGQHVRAFVEARTAQCTDRDLPGGRRAADMDTLDVFQAFVDVTAPLGGPASARLRVGRQSFLFGNQRLVSPLLWINVWNAWDGVSGRVAIGEWTVDAFHAAYVQIDRTSWNERDDDRLLYGVYATKAAPKDGRGLDLYALGNTRPDVAVNGSSGDERRWTLGARSFGSLGAAFDGELEGAWQTGEVGGADVDAWFVSSVVGRTFADAPAAPRAFVGLDAASGDARPGGDVGTFHQLFPLGHAYFGYADAIGRQNIAAAQFGAQWRLGPSTMLTTTAHVFRLMDRDDALYGVTGAASRTGLASRDVGQEIDLLLAHRVSRHVDGYIGYSHVFAGGGLVGTGPTEDIDFAYVGAAFVF